MVILLRLSLFHAPCVSPTGAVTAPSAAVLCQQLRAAWVLQPRAGPRARVQPQPWHCWHGAVPTGLLQGQAGAGGWQSLGAARGAGRYGTGTAWSTQLIGLRHVPEPQVKTQGKLQLCCSTRSAETSPDPSASLFSWVLTVEGTGIPCRCHGVKRPCARPWQSP